MNKTIYLKDYVAPCFEVLSIELWFDLYDEYVLVKNKMQFERKSPGLLRLNGSGLQLEACFLNQETMVLDQLSFEGEDLILDPALSSFELTVVTRIFPQSNTALSGLYRSNHLFCTQCEAEGFRRITYFPDRPDVLTTFTTHMTAEVKRYPVLLSNGHLVHKETFSDGRHAVTWFDPFKKPCYLFALVAGQLVCVSDHFETMSGRRIELNIYVEPGNETSCAHALTSLKKAMRWDEERYGREYDLDLFMIVAVSDFNMGAMENKGLNIFNAKYILARPETATDQDYLDIESVVAHEYFHNWTGNRITCRDWFQLSLKEGLTVFRDQEFSRDMNDSDVCRIGDVRALRQTQFPEDAGQMAHPVQPCFYEEINNFYTATIYNKGAEVIRMIETLIGRDRFRQGMDLYFSRYDGQAVTIQDFVHCMSDAAYYDFSQFMRWYTQAGTPKVSVVREQYDADTKQLAVTLTQTCAQTADGSGKLPFVIPLRYRCYDYAGAMCAEGVFILKTEEDIFFVDGLDTKPLLSLLQDFSAPIELVRTQERAEVLSLLSFERNGVVKWDIIERLSQDFIHTRYAQTEDVSVSDPSLFSVFADILEDETLELSLRAELLTPLSFEAATRGLSAIDILKLEKARGFFRTTLAECLSKKASFVFEHAGRRALHGQQMAGFRSLRQLCLSFMVRAQQPGAIQLAQQQYETASTMTEQLGSFQLLVHFAPDDIREDIIQRFYSKWQHHELVLDKWFAIQALSERSGTLNHIKQLMDHPKFNWTNPNKVYALLGAFSMRNPLHFHAKDGSGYQLLVEAILRLDALNPQIAARLMTPFTRWKQWDSSYGTRMLESLNELSSYALSKDVGEIIDRCVNA